MGIFKRKPKVDEDAGITDRENSAVKGRDSSSEEILSDETAFYKRPTALRLFTAFVYLVALVFLILVEIGNLSNSPVLRNIYFIKINLANIIPESIPNATLINTIAQSLGLHDFYQVGLWNFCAGYQNQGITTCSQPKTLYWFNPVEIIMSELLVGATIALPTDIIDILNIVKTVSNYMFGCFLVGTILTFICIFVAPMGFSKKPRWSHRGKRIITRNLPVTILTFLALLLTAVATVMATAMFIIFKNVIGQAKEFNIEGELGLEMLVFEWIAVGALLIGFIMQFGTCCGVCCCTGRKKAIRKQRESRTEEK